MGEARWYRLQGEYLILHIIAKPRARKTQLIAITEEAIHIALQAQPHEGAANKELITYLAELLQIPKTQALLERGQASKYKQVKVPLTLRVQQFLQRHKNA